MKTTRILIMAVTAAVLTAFAFQASAQDKAKPKKEEEKVKVEVRVEGVQGGVEGGVEGGILGGVEGGVLGGIEGGVIGGEIDLIDTDFILEPLKVIQLKIEHLEILPTETIALDVLPVNIETVSGRPVKVAISIRKNEKSQVKLAKKLVYVNVILKPHIIEGKGIDMDVDIERDGIKIKADTLTLRNLNPVLVELFENKDVSIKIAEKITPLIIIIIPPGKYSGPIETVEMVDSILLMNGQMLSKGSGLRTTNPGESPIFLFFYTSGKGIFVLSFGPFAGAEPLGVVNGSVIKVKHGGDLFEWISMRPILPGGKWRVWVRNNPDYHPTRDPRLKHLYGTDAVMFDEKNKAWIGIGSGEQIIEQFFPKKPPLPEL